MDIPKVHESDLLTSLDEMRQTVLDNIPREEAMNLIERTLRRAGPQAPIEVSRFGSSI